MSSPVGSAEFMAPEVVRAFCAMDDERVKYDQNVICGASESLRKYTV